MTALKILCDLPMKNSENAIFRIKNRIFHSALQAKPFKFGSH